MLTKILKLEINALDDEYIECSICKKFVNKKDFNFKENKCNKCIKNNKEDIHDTRNKKTD